MVSIRHIREGNDKIGDENKNTQKNRVVFKFVNTFQKSYIKNANKLLPRRGQKRRVLATIYCSLELVSLFSTSEKAKRR
jgi:hypothetical protein